MQQVQSHFHIYYMFPENRYPIFLLFQAFITCSVLFCDLFFYTKCTAILLYPQSVYSGVFPDKQLEDQAVSQNGPMNWSTENKHGSNKQLPHYYSQELSLTEQSDLQTYTENALKPSSHLQQTEQLLPYEQPMNADIYRLLKANPFQIKGLPS